MFLSIDTVCVMIKIMVHWLYLSAHYLVKYCCQLSTNISQAGIAERIVLINVYKVFFQLFRQPEGRAYVLPVMLSF